jgi:hypothetical protein
MIVLALLLAAIGTVDLVRARARDPRSLWLPSACGVAVFLLAALGTGLPWWWCVVGVLAVVAWALATSPFASAPVARRTAERPAYWAIRVLALGMLAAFAAAPWLPSPSGPLPDWYRALEYSALDDVAFTTFALAVGGVLFLFETANVIVRAALHATGSDAADTTRETPVAVPAPHRERWWRRDRLPAPQVAELAPLKGGRFIGPLERVFLLTLALSGQFTAIAAVVAAKGIIRFPEISKDDAGGSKAEYFLVGSFASWGLVLAAAVIIHFSALN